MTRGHDGRPRELQAGDMVGEYRVDQQIGEGGMGKVYAATHPVIAKRAAIKILHPELSMNRDAVERFVQEARSVNQIGHPNIVDIFSFGALPDGRCYFVMEWLRGESLRDRMRKVRISIAEALAFCDTIAVALEAAHEKGIVHRDLKPDNIYLCDVKGAMPQVKLLDFGIAKLLGDDGRMERTRTGNLMGTPAYMSPEQARGQHVDHRTDIYALGCVAYETFTGSLPFPADNAADMMAKHLFEPPPSVMLRNPSIPPELDALVMHMLAKDSRSRPTLDQIRDHLRRAMQVIISPGYGRVATPAGGVPYAPHMMPSSFPHAMMPAMTPSSSVSQLTPRTAPQVTPGLGQVPAGGHGAMHTPAPGTTSLVDHRPPVAARRATLLVILVSAVVSAAIGVAIVSSLTTTDRPPRAVAAEPATPPEGTTDKTVARPTEPAAPVLSRPVAPAIEAVAPAADPSVSSPPPADATPPVTTKPVTTKPVTTKPVTTKPRVPRKPPRASSPKQSGVTDDDAPM